MAAIGSSQVYGPSFGTLPEVETADLALRTTIKPFDGISQNGWVGGINIAVDLSSAAGPISYTNAVMWALQFLQPDYVMRIRNVGVSHQGPIATTGLVAGVYTFGLFMITDFNAQFSNDGGVSPNTSSTLVTKIKDFGNNTFPSTAMNIAWHNITAATLGGMDSQIGRVDANAVASVTVASPPTAGKSSLPLYYLWNTQMGDQPIELNTGMGICIKATTPVIATTGTANQNGLMNVTFLAEVTKQQTLSYIPPDTAVGLM